jgi:hypothetical protein
MKIVRNLSLLVCVLLVAPSLAAETMAVSVRHQSERESAPQLAELVEQGAMEHLFSSGNIVFDLDLDDADEAYRFRAIDQARTGGASSVIVLELTFRSAGAKGLIPERVTVTVLDVASEEELGERTLYAEQLEGFAEMTATVIADRLGGWAARIALESTGGGDAQW